MSIYCTYITFYRGNKLPPFYIGSTKIVKINNGYHGSVRSKKFRNVWEDEQAKNPHLFKTIILTKHDDHGDALEREAKFQKALNVIDNPLYANLGIAKRGFGNLSAESRKLISEKAKKRDYSYMKGSNHRYFGGRSDLDQRGSKNPNAKACYINGIQFGSIADASRILGISYKKCINMIHTNHDGCKLI